MLINFENLISIERNMYVIHNVIVTLCFAQPFYGIKIVSLCVVAPIKCFNNQLYIAQKDFIFIKLKTNKIETKAK